MRQWTGSRNFGRLRELHYVAEVDMKPSCTDVVPCSPSPPRHKAATSISCSLLLALTTSQGFHGLLCWHREVCCRFASTRCGWQLRLLLCAQQRLWRDQECSKLLRCAEHHMRASPALRGLSRLPVSLGGWFPHDGPCIRTLRCSHMLNATGFLLLSCVLNTCKERTREQPRLKSCEARKRPAVAHKWH